MSKVTADRVLNGKNGSLWIDGELVAEVNSFEAKLTAKVEDVAFAGEMMDDVKITGWTGAGSIELKKVYSRFQKLVLKSLEKGITPRFTVVAAIEDPQALGYERVQLENVVFTEIPLGSFDINSLANESIPFRFSKHRMLEQI